MPTLRELLLGAAITLVAGLGVGCGEESVGQAGGGVADCDPNYVGACLDPSAPDYDCSGGSGDGPLYTGTVTVVGSDHYGLDGNGNGVGCEPY